MALGVGRTAKRALTMERVLFLDRSDLILLQLMMMDYSPCGATPPIYRSVLMKVRNAAWLSCMCEMPQLPLDAREIALLRQCNTDFCAELASRLSATVCQGADECIALTTYKDATRLQHLFSTI